MNALAFSPFRWSLWTARGRTVPDGLDLYAAWLCDWDGSLTFSGGADLKDSRRRAMHGSGPGDPMPKLLWVVLAADHDSALTRYHELMGWRVYKPMEVNP